MKIRINPRECKPVTVSLASFLLLVIIVTGIGLLGGQHIVRYVQDRVVRHGVEHNEHILEGMLPLLRYPLVQGVPTDRILRGFQQFIDHAAPFGVRIFLIDAVSREVVADSELAKRLPLALNRFWPSAVYRLDGGALTDPLAWRGPGGLARNEKRVLTPFSDPFFGPRCRE